MSLQADLNGWPALPYSEWKDTCQTLYLWTQIGRCPMLQKIVLSIALALPLAASSIAFADTTEDDVTWINQCIADNKGQPGGTEEIVRKYCMCMNEKMDTNERRSVTQWEKSHRAERDACSKDAGWR